MAFNNMQKQIIAVAGLSSDTNKYWYKIFKDIKAYGAEVYCVNPKIPQDPENGIFSALADIPAKINILILVVRPEFTLDLVKQALKAGAEDIWFQPGTFNEEAALEAQKGGAQVHNGCYMVQNGIW